VVTRVAVTGASGNVGYAVLRNLAGEGTIDHIVGLARRVPDWDAPKVSWQQADVTTADLVPIFSDVDAVIHLAWLIQPSRRPEALHATNVVGTQRVFEAAAAAGVHHVVYASSVGTYSPGPKDPAVDESWPAGGVASSFYGRHKAEVERWLDHFEPEYPDIRVVRLRPGLVFQRAAASEIARLFLGPFVPMGLLRRTLIPVVPKMDRLRFQVVHADDLADAYRRALLSDVRGAFNIAADPVLDSDALAGMLRARQVPLPASVLKAAASVTWKAHLQPTPPGWIDLALQTPIMDTGRAKTELGWYPSHSAEDALTELLPGFAEKDFGPTPPLVRGARLGASSALTPGG
jgi:UDP-glucose 4-epimerase